MPSHGFPASVARVIRERSGDLCEVCRAARGIQIHHRRPRGAGGSRDKVTNGVANGLRIDLACHDWIENNRTAARDLGLLLLRHQDPRAEPVRLATPYGRGWFLLSDDGAYMFADPPSLTA